MRIGIYKSRLIVERPVNRQDTENGGEIPDFAFYCEVWARIEPLKGRELLRDEQIVADLDTIIRTRWSPHLDIVTSKWRLRHVEGTIPTIYNIAGPPAHKNMGHRELYFSAKSGINEG